ncbi:MAG: protein kinase [Prevotella sp.]|nr:protein kinase [Prevotella sp.]
METTLRNPSMQQGEVTKAVPVAGETPERTLRPNAKPQDAKAGQGDFTLKGKVYRNLKCLSDNSGEAQVFLVSNEEQQYVLKVYYPNFTVKKTLLRIIQNFGFEMVVRIYDFGKTYVDGKNRDYELMEYLEGDTLNEYHLDGDIDTFRRIALQAAAALSYCHTNNIIHKDIKPSNYFFRDAEHTELVLGDFGISSILEGDERVHRTTQARTPVYAAPEMYNDVIDGVVEITPAVDYYSLGLTLLTLWLGENPLSSNERVMMRKKNEGRIPRVNELPERVKMIVQGLTAVNPQSRWTYDEVERWFLGEKVEVDISSPILKYKSFIVDPERNLVADNVHELIPLLIDNERLAINYLYSGRISNWLESCGNTKLSTVVKDITVNRYPVDQQAGLMAAVYTMEPTYPYKDLHGNLCDDVHSAAISVLSYTNEYALALANPHDRLYLYLESHSKCNVDRIRSYFKREDNEQPNARIAILRAVYEMDPEIPFLAKFPSSSLSEIVRSFGVEDCNEDEWLSLSDGRLLSWMYSHEDRMACEALRIMTNGQKPTRQLGYKVLYNINRDAAFDLRSADTPLKVGEVLCENLKEWQQLSEDEFNARIADYADADGRFSYFAQLHGWFSQINEARRCFDLKSDENRDRLCAYDLRTAAYRFCRILGATPAYRLASGVELSDGTHIDHAHYTEARNELRNGALGQWMAVFYHEDPHKDFSETYSYEHSLEKWVLAMGDIDPQQKYYKRYQNAKEQTARKYDEVRTGYRDAKAKEYVWRMTFYGLCGLWMLLVLLFGVSGRSYLLGHSFFTIGLPLGGMTAAIVGTRAYFRGYGFVFSCLWGFLGALSSVIPIMTLKYVNHHIPSLFVVAVLVLTAVYMAICHLTDFRGDSKEDNRLISEVLDDDIKSDLLEPLYYTFKTKAYRFKGSKFGMLDDVQNQIRSISGESVLHYVLWSVLVGILLLEFIVYSPSLLNVNNPDLNDWRLKPHNVVKQIQIDVE